MKLFFIKSIRWYQKYISPLFPRSCRFHPTCSQYCKECFESLPLHKALLLSVWRILRCNPFTRGGNDPVVK